MAGPKTDEKLIATPFFFQFAVPCLYHAPLWTRKGVQLGEAFRLPSFAELDKSEDEDGDSWADVRAAWSEEGIAINVRTQGKRQPPWCRGTRIDASDGLFVWIGTRDVSGIHRANRFCHQFVFLPNGSGTKMDQPVAAAVPIDRAREHPKAIKASALKVRSEKRVDGYVLEALITAEALTGFDPAEQTQLGFAYAVVDREMGEKTLTVGSEFPFRSDPTLWSVLDLVRK